MPCNPPYRALAAALHRENLLLKEEIERAGDLAEENRRLRRIVASYEAAEVGMRAVYKSEVRLREREKNLLTAQHADLVRAQELRREVAVLLEQVVQMERRLGDRPPASPSNEMANWTRQRKAQAFAREVHRIVAEAEQAGRRFARQQDVADYLNEIRHPTPRGLIGHWTRQLVHRIRWQ